MIQVALLYIDDGFLHALVRKCFQAVLGRVVLKTGLANLCHNKNVLTFIDI